MRAREAEIDRATLRRAAEGDVAARTRFVERYQRLVFSTASRVLGPHAEEVRDVAQDTFVRAFSSLRGFDPEGTARVSTWLSTIAARRAIDVARRRGRVVSLEEARQASEPDLATVDPGEVIDEARERAALRAAMERLGADQRAVIVLRVEQEMTLEAIAEALGVELGTVKSRLSRARAQLARSLQNGQRELREDQHAR